MLGVGYLERAAIGILSLLTSIGSRLLLLGFRSIIMVRVVLLLIRWFGIRGANLRFVRLTFGLQRILPHFLALLDSLIVIGFRFMLVTILMLMLLLGPVVCWYSGSVHFLSGYLTLAIWLC